MKRLILLAAAAAFLLAASSADAATFVHTWGGPGSKAGQFNNAHGIALDQYGNVYVADTDNERVEKFDAQGNFIKEWSWWGDGTTANRFHRPTGIAINPNGGYVYVTDRTGDRVVKFDLNGTFIRSFGSTGGGPRELYHPHGIAVEKNGRVLVADTGNNRIAIFDGDGTWVRSFGSKGAGHGQLFEPEGVTTDTAAGVCSDCAHHIYVADTKNFRIEEFTDGGEYVSTIERAQGVLGHFCWPTGVAIAPHGQIYVVDPYCDRINIFDRYGNFLERFGSFGTQHAQFKTPWGLAVAIRLEGFTPVTHIYVSDTLNYRIQVFSSLR